MHCPPKASSRNSIDLDYNMFSDHFTPFWDKRMKKNEQDFSDIEVYYGGKIWYLHKVLLSIRPYFKKLVSKTNSSQPCIIENPEPNPKAFDRLLKFIYFPSPIETQTDIENLEETEIKSLLVEAARFQMMDIKDMCEKKLLDTINSANVLSLLLFGMEQSLEALKGQALKLMVSCIQSGAITRETILNELSAMDVEKKDKIIMLFIMEKVHLNR